MQGTLFTNTKEMRRDFAKLKSCWSNESILNTGMLLWLCEFFERNAPAKKAKRPLSKWQKFFSQAMRDGLSAEEAAAQWKKHKSCVATVH